MALSRVQKAVFLLLVVSALVLSGLMFYFNRKLETQDDAFISSSLPENVESVVTSSEEVPGVVTLDSPDGTQVAHVTGTLNGAFERDGHYFFKVVVPKGDGQFALTVDLGDRNVVVADHLIEYDQNTSIKTDNFVNKDAEQIFDKYKGYSNKEITLDIIVSADFSNLPPDCDANCTSRIEMYKQYEFSNKNLLTLDLVNEPTLTVGLVNTVRVEI